MKRFIVNSLFRDTVDFRICASDTNGAFGEYDVKLMPGGKNPLHVHALLSEKFTVVEGRLGVMIGPNNPKILEVGESYEIKPGQPHNFYNPTGQPVKFQLRITPGNEGFENALRILYGLAEDDKTNNKGIPTDFSTICLLFVMGDMRLHGFQWRLLDPIIKFVARRAKRRGKTAQLIETYC